jgi:hypothetical protein
LEDTEFIRRFAMHIPPPGFVRIRHYGILSSTAKKETIPCIRAQEAEKADCFIDKRKVKSFDPSICPSCGKATMVTLEILRPGGPPRCLSENTVMVKYLAK